jgi:hypothetical protein
MLGLVFTEFMEMVEARFSDEVLDDVLDSVELSTGGVYTAVGYYDHTDMVRMVVALSQRVDMPVDDLIEAFGVHLFGVLAGKYPVMLEGYSSPLDFLESVDAKVHKEVLKLYPEAELPRFTCERVAPARLLLHYSSKRPFSRLALGLIRGCAAHFGCELEISASASQSGDLYLSDFDIRVRDE